MISEMVGHFDCEYSRRVLRVWGIETLAVNDSNLCSFYLSQIQKVGKRRRLCYSKVYNLHRFFSTKFLPERE